MPAFFIVGTSIPLDANSKNRNRGTYDEYIAKVKPLVERYGGKYLVRSGNVTPFSGNWNPDRVIVIEFATIERLHACFSSPEYTEIAALRTSSVQTDAVIVEA